MSLAVRHCVNPLMSSSTLCIPPDLDVAGIGVRVAIYVQNILVVITSVVSLWDGEVCPKEFKFITNPTVNIFILMWAISVSAFSLPRIELRGTNFYTQLIYRFILINYNTVLIWILVYVFHRIKHNKERFSLFPFSPQWQSIIMNRT